MKLLASTPSQAALEFRRVQHPVHPASPEAGDGNGLRPEPPIETPEHRRDPRNPDHPAHALARWVRSEVAKAESVIGKPWDENSERLTANLFGLARENGTTIGHHGRTEEFDSKRLAQHSKQAPIAKCWLGAG